MVTYIRSDLDFILTQIKIAERHAAGETLDQIFNDPDGNPLTADAVPLDRSLGLRTVDGTFNNLLLGRSEWGASDNQFPELLDPAFRTIMVDPDGAGPAPAVPMTYTPGVDNDGPGTFAGPGDVIDPYVRVISNLIVDQTPSNPAAIMVALDRSGVPPANQLGIALQIKAEYEAIEGLFKAVDDATDAFKDADAAAEANPGDGPLQAARDQAALDLAAAEQALADARGPLDALLAANGVELDGINISILNVAPDEGLSAPFNSWFTLFGQFFDHGLDLVNKGGSGTVMIPLMPDDPLFVPGSTTNFMVLTRATVAPGLDGVFGTGDDVRPTNLTTSFVDQNQTYTSHSSHQVFLRQYVLNAAGDPVPTGALIEGVNGGMATWADVKAQAADLLGIQLSDAEVGNVPLLFTDQYGKFIPGINGFPQLVMPDGSLVEGNPAANGGLGVPSAGAVRTGHAFLADIAHDAVPNGLADGDIEVGLGNTDPDGNPTTDLLYDNELLDAHFIAGDGRGNENVGLTAVHHVFHSEHNRLVEHTKTVVVADAAELLATNGGNQAAAVAFLNEWLVTDVAAVPTTPAEIDALVWDGERLFQAAKFGTEMQYQHLVFEEFARKIQPQIDAFIVPQGYEVDIDPSIVAEFAHVVYRFGHSMLTETVDRFDPSFNATHIGLIEAFLNPLNFANGGGDSPVTADIAAGAIIRGMTRQPGNEIDEFVTGALRNNLLGLPLDLATINMARGRDTGVPSLNAARREFFEATNQNSLLTPYTSWQDFTLHLKNEASIINFVAAYGTHSLITSQGTAEGKRDAALTIITGQSFGGLTVPEDRLDFLNATGAYAVDGLLGGLENVDLWIGGLAEEIMPFGGMLGSTFNFVFETSLEKLQNGDRFYYLQRLDGLHLFGEMEGNSFAAMISRNTDATHLPSDVFSTPGLILEVDRRLQFNPGLGETDGILQDGLEDNPATAVDESADNLGNDPEDGSIFGVPLVLRNNPATPGEDTNYLQYTGEDHVVLGGTNVGNTFNQLGNDILIASIGDDTLYGDSGNDRLEGGFGNDIINGGSGDDIITDAGGDDNIKAQEGNDFVNAGPGLDLVMGGEGNDFIVLGTDAGSEVFAGTGNDYILGATGTERILGNEGDDWIEHGTFDGAPGDNFDEINALDLVIGHDVFVGAATVDEFIGEGGDDIMVGSDGVNKHNGMSGFDWVTYKDSLAVDRDLSLAPPVVGGIATGDTFAEVEGISGSAFDDTLRGTAIDATTIGAQGNLGSRLTNEGVLRIAGLAEVLGLDPVVLAANPTGIAFETGDIILGGSGGDNIEGRGGDDVIDGDKWLDVQIAVYGGFDANGVTGNPLEFHNSMTTLVNRIVSGEINPGQLQIHREIKIGTGGADTAIFSGNFVDYEIFDGATQLDLVDLQAGGPFGQLRIVDTNGIDSTAEGDLVSGVERLAFADQIVQLLVNNAPTVAPPAAAIVVVEDGLPVQQAIGASDIDGDALTYAVKSGTEPSKGTVTFQNGSFTYTPLLNANGPDTFTIVVTDALGAAVEKVVSVNITPVNDAPVVSGPITLPASDEDSVRVITSAELLANASDVDGDTFVTNLAIATGGGVLVNNNNGTWNYTPVPDDNTAVSFTYQVTDGTVAVATSASLDILPVNDVPVVSGPLTLPAIDEDSGARIITSAELLANASDVDGDTLTVINLAIATGGGALLNNNNGTWSYTPALNDDTAVSFTYQVTDGTVAVDTSATLDILPVADVVILPGTPGNDNATVPTGNSEFHAGVGTDTATFGFRLVDATVSWSGNQIIVDSATSHTVMTSVERFVFTDGTIENNDGNALVDDLFYYSSYHDIWNAGVSADTHYADFGWNEPRDPNAFFDTSFYLALNPDVDAANVNPIQHFHTNGWAEGRIPSLDFDPVGYLSNNPDVLGARIDPLQHFLAFGAAEGRQPVAFDELLAANGFDYVHYLQSNPDVDAAGVNPLQHFQTYGWQEGRNPNALFDTAGYLATYTDVVAAGINPLDHYNEFGWREGRDPSIAFDTTSYLAGNPDVAAANINPLSHYLDQGIHEGRSAFADGLWG